MTLVVSLLSGVHFATVGQLLMPQLSGIGCPLSIPSSWGDVGSWKLLWMEPLTRCMLADPAHLQGRPSWREVATNA